MLVRWRFQDFFSLFSFSLRNNYVEKLTQVSLFHSLQLSKDSELPSNIVRLADILLRYLMHEHVDYAIDLGLQAIPLGENKIFPQIYFFDVVQKCNTIVVLLEKLYSASVFPCVE